jgi:hypothetical protein|tara:strand:+ start:106 stop:837 length:732 start_codon:yes stop_codon:yes gene_type:complete
MPLKKCTTDNKNGYKWGNEGTCYPGPEGKKKAIKQGLAIEGPEKFSQKALVESYIYFNKQDIKTVTDWMYNEGYDYGDIAATASILSSHVVADKWDKIDKKELKRDTKKEKKEHEKDAIKDDKEKLKRLKKDPPSEKKKRETKDLKKDERYDKKDAKSASDKEEYRQDKREMDSETLRERLKHHKDAVKNLEREIKDLKKDKKEDERDVKTESKGDDVAGYPPNCNKGYVEKNSKCVPTNETD